MAQKTPKKSSDNTLEVISTFKKVFSTYDGKKVLRHLMKQNFVLEGIHSDYSEVPDRTIFFREGRRSVVMDIIDLIQTDEKQMLEFLEDSRDELIEEQDLM